MWLFKFQRKVKFYAKFCLLDRARRCHNQRLEKPFSCHRRKADVWPTMNRSFSKIRAHEKWSDVAKMSLTNFVSESNEQFFQFQNFLSQAKDFFLKIACPEFFSQRIWSIGLNRTDPIRRRVGRTILCENRKSSASASAPFGGQIRQIVIGIKLTRMNLDKKLPRLQKCFCKKIVLDRKIWTRGESWTLHSWMK